MMKGTSLVEALTALLVLTIGSLGMIISIKGSVQNFSAAKINNQATVISNQIYNELKSINFDDLQTRTNTIQADYIYNYEGENIGAQGTPDADAVEYFRIDEIVLNQLSPDAYEVTLTIGWLSQESQRETESRFEADGLAYQHKFILARNEAN